ncbi:MAG: hypothetical protein K6A44_02990 [bacterium]|nr:hypothetical protein [bacterium]
MAPIDAINMNNPFMMQGISQYQGGTPQRVNPFETPKVGGVEGVQGAQQFGSEYAEIAARGMRVNDSEIGVNQPMATTPQKQLGREGVVGANFRMCM